MFIYQIDEVNEHRSNVHLAQTAVRWPVVCMSPYIHAYLNSTLRTVTVLFYEVFLAFAVPFKGEINAKM